MTHDWTIAALPAGSRQGSSAAAAEVGLQDTHRQAVLGFAVVLMALPVFLAAARLADATSDVEVAATDAAAWVARHGIVPPDADDAIALSIEVDGARVRVLAETDVDLLGVAGSTVTMRVSSRAVVPISPYRSRVG